MATNYLKRLVGKYKYLWRAEFKGRTIHQHPDDLYSKHDPKADWNPSSFRDFEEYWDEHRDDLETFTLWGDGDQYTVDFTKKGYPVIRMLKMGRNWAGDKVIILHREKRELTNISVVFARVMEQKISMEGESEPEVKSYVLGYCGTDKNGNPRQKTITVI